MNSDKKKRLIIPVATLMVAIVMMAGVGYAAISSTFTVTENSTLGGEFEVSVDGYTTGGKILNDVKIPYAVDTNDGIKTYKVPTGTNKEFVTKTVKITNDTGEEIKGCSINGKITGGSLKDEVKSAISFKFYNESNTEVTTVDVANGTPVTLTMKVVLNVTSDIPIANSDDLNSTDITIEISAGKA